MQCEAWYLTLRVFESRLLERALGPKRDDVTEEWKRLYNEELMICTAHRDQINKNEMGGTYDVRGLGGET